MATKSKLELAVDAGKWEDGLRKAQNSMKAFEQSIGGLEKATSSEKEKMAQFIQILGNTKSTAATASQQVKEYRSTIERLQVISTKLNDEQKKLADDAMAKLTKRMQEAKGQVDQLNLSMNETSDKGNSTGNVIEQLAGKFGLSTKELLSFGSALAIGKTALDTMKGAMESNEATHDAYARTVEVCDAVTNQFLLDLANADFSSFISGLQGVIDKAIDAYNSLDEFESYAARFNPAQQAQEAKIQTLMQQARAAKAQGDNAKAEKLNNEAKQLINKLEQTTKEYGQKQTTAGYATIRSKMGEVGITDQQIAWYADPKNWDKAQQKAKEYQRIQNEIKRDQQTLNSNLGWSDSAKIMYADADARLKANQQALRNDPSLKRSYTFQNLRDSGEEGAAFRQALGNIYGNTMAESRIESLRARAERMDGVITNATKPTKPTTPTTKPEAIIPEGSIAEAEAKLAELNKIWKEAGTQDERDNIAKQIADANAQLDIMKGKVADVKMPEMAEGFAGASDASIKAWIDGIKEQLSNAEYGSAIYTSLKAQLADATTFKNIVEQWANAGLRMTELDTEELWDKLISSDGDTIPDSTWQSLVDEINEKLATLDIDAIKINFDTGNIEKVNQETKKCEDSWMNAAHAAQQFGSVLQSIEDPTAKVTGIIAQAIATIALTFSKSLNGTATPWDWIAGAAAGTATMISTIAAIKAATATEKHAGGGFIGGHSYTGDNIMMPIDGGMNGYAGLNSGELVLNRAQQTNLANQLRGGSLTAQGGTFRMELEGYKLVGLIKNELKLEGRKTL